MQKKAVITGATGFLGKALLQKLIESNYLPFILVRKDSNLENIVELLPFCECVYYETLKDSELIKNLENAINADIFIHCAWKGVSNAEREQSSQITYNIALTIDTVTLANQINCKKWVGIGSQAEYGIVNKIANEDSTPVNPFSAYGKAKAACYWAASGLCQIFGLEMVWCRVFSLYGINDNANYLIPYVIQSFIEGKSPSLTGCEQKWDYLHVKDGANAIINLAQSNGTGIFNIGSGKTVVLKEVIEIIKRKINPNLSIAYGEKTYSDNQIMHLESDMSKLKKVLDWHPTIDLKNGLTETIQFYQNKFTNP